MKRFIIFALLYGAPLIAGAASAQAYLADFLSLFNTVLIPIIFSIATLFFIWNAARFFIFKAGSDDGREAAKRLMLYGILAFVIMLSIWGIVNLGMSALGINRANVVCPDYFPNCGS